MTSVATRHCEVCGTHKGDRARCALPWCASHKIASTRPPDSLAAYDRLLCEHEVTLAALRELRDVAHVVCALNAEAVSCRIHGAPKDVTDEVLQEWRNAIEALRVASGWRPTLPADARPPAFVCSTCNDTHTMQFGERDPVSCTYCPVPCELCRQRHGAYCQTTPCICVCHAPRLP